MIQTATLKNGVVLSIGDEVTTNYHKTCIGRVFVVCQLSQFRHCSSGFMVVVHLKGEPDRKIVGMQKEGMDLGPPGIDGSWFVKVNQ